MIYRHIDIERDRFKLVNLGHFLPPYPNKTPKNQYFEKMKKQFWKYHHFTHVYQKPQSGTEIRSERDKMFCHLC